MSSDNINEKGEISQRFEVYKNLSGGTYPTGPSSDAPLSDYFPLVVRAPYRGEMIIIAHVYHHKAKEHAALLAAAPNLLETLKYCQSWFERFAPTADLIDGNKGELPMLTSVKSAIAEVMVI